MPAMPGQLVTWWFDHTNVGLGKVAFFVGFGKDGSIHLTCFHDDEEFDFPNEDEAKEFAKSYLPIPDSPTT